MAECRVCGQWYSDSDYNLYAGCSDCVNRYKRERREEEKQLGLDPGSLGFNEWCNCAIVKLQDASGEIPHKVAVDQIRAYAADIKRRRAESEERCRREAQKANAKQAALNNINPEDYYS